VALVRAVGPVGAEQCRQRIPIISVAVQAMAERASTLARQPKILKAVKAFDVVITMGYGNTCSYSMGNTTRTVFGRSAREAGSESSSNATGVVGGSCRAHRRFGG
jgi:hypothetical protein